ncbi:MAG TPA: adenosylmethionine--8-amino-7-oxononanoate transaminase [Pirellulales bacterium]|nr:adenosylmethionine--8-amino-7-oxononanoate transaminase [Pirellulales bacterium]
MSLSCSETSVDSGPAWQRDAANHLWMPYTQMQTAPLPLPVVATEDVYLVLSDGRRLIDGLASWWTACHGYNHPHIAERVAAQLEVMPHVMLGGIHHEGAVTLARRLADLLPGDLSHVFFSDSGSVAVEVAMKMAVQMWRNRGERDRNRFVTFKHAYHGDTTGAMSLSDPERSMHAHFKGFLLEQYCRPIPETDEEQAAFCAFLESHREQLAAVVIEPLVQGAGGMRFHSPAALAAVARIARQQGLLLVADEIATGFGRTGSMFACEQAEVVPDIMCLGKALTAGTLGMAATLATGEVFEAFLGDESEKALMHGPTYMANPLACAAAHASLDLFEQHSDLAQVQAIEKSLTELLKPCRSLPGVVDVRTRGAIAVVQVERLHSEEKLCERFVQAGIWLRPFHDMFYLTPPLSITPDQLHQLAGATVEVIGDWSRS